MVCRAWQAHGKLLKGLQKVIEKKQIHMCQTAIYICEIPKGVYTTAEIFFRGPQIRKG